MASLDDSGSFLRVLDLEVPWAHAYASMTAGKTDIERRENYRRAALEKISLPTDKPFWWAFRISVTKAGRALDIDNVPKTIVDSFCARQIARDGSAFYQLGLYPDDNLEYVRYVQVQGRRSSEIDSTRIEIFACINSELDGLLS